MCSGNCSMLGNGASDHIWSKQGEPGRIHSCLPQAEPPHQTSQRQHQEIPRLVPIPSWVLWRAPCMASTPKKGLTSPASPCFDSNTPEQCPWPRSAGSRQGRGTGDAGCCRLEPWNPTPHLGAVSLSTAWLYVRVHSFKSGP